ncbi:hypothetical protein [Thalassorhabdomicrobium marinisediminis]|uniref:hypothetical protein n=1 Tax=Thalassorhabdomicrobium marinisediminis TaxID=2170577 RepID=UPI002490C6EE|nr:hypothetical protein [Thalassorhabdomicrobium marinisediminis]
MINHRLRAAEAKAQKLVADHKDMSGRVTEALLNECELDKEKIEKPFMSADTRAMQSAIDRADQIKLP